MSLCWPAWIVAGVLSTSEVYHFRDAQGIDHYVNYAT